MKIILKNKRKGIVSLIIIVLILTIIVSVCKIRPKSEAQTETTSSIEITYECEGNGQITETTTANTDTYGALLLDFGDEDTSNWTYDDITDTYIDENGETQTATYKASFAGWKLVSINGENVTEEYIYPDNDYIYMNDEPFASYSSITSATFEATWGKTVYVRDEYNFVDITNVYGYDDEDGTGDILTAKINWNTATSYSSDYYSGATEDEPVSTLEHAYELLESTNGGKIYIVNHLTLEAPESYQSYSSSFKNASQTYYFDCGAGLDITGVVTVSGEGMGLRNKYRK